MRDLIQNVFTEILENPEFDLILIEKYFSKDYIQVVDDKQLNYDEFVLHIKKLKEKVIAQKMEILNYAENDTVIFTHHTARSVLKNGNIVVHKVLAEFTVHNNKITKCNELTLLLEGNHSEKNLASEM